MKIGDIKARDFEERLTEEEKRTLMLFGAESLLDLSAFRKGAWSSFNGAMHYVSSDDATPTRLILRQLNGEKAVLDIIYRLLSHPDIRQIVDKLFPDFRDTEST